MNTHRFIVQAAAPWFVAMVLALISSARAQVFTDPALFHAAAGPAEHLVTADDLPHNTTLTTQCAGINFGGTVRTWDAISFGGGGTAVSPRNVLFNFGSAPMRWTFATPARSMGVYNPSIFDRIRLRLLRADNTEITSIDMNTGVVTFAGYISSEDIVSVEAAGIAGFSNFTIFLDNLEWGSGCPRVLSQPVSASTCPSGAVTFSVAAAGAAPLSYQWQWHPAGVTQWTDVVEGTNSFGGAVYFDAQGARAAQTVWRMRKRAEVLYSRCIATNPCGTDTSNPATVTLTPGCNLADIVSIGGGTLPDGTACPDGLLTGDDFNAFIAAFAADLLLADIVSIGGELPPDGLVTGDDFNAFIAAFANGCP